MSTILLRRTVSVAIESREAGREFADASSDVQVEFLLGWLEASMKWSWPQQCRCIIDDLPKDKRVDLIVLLKTLTEHLEEP